MTDPARLVDTYLQHCEDRELDAASRFLGPGARLQFPGGATYSSLQEMVGSPKAYTWVRKHRDRFVVSVEGDLTTVVSIGRLYGERLDGTPFEDIRYVDVFGLRDGLIVEQLVWNDLPEAGLVPAS
ncbi:nuclear transport factor 2 family protein [Nocardioides marmotae]|uniref:nuclear transport factor 2 family protein n=1 Tax=Nocardioides marmotae TaxID=2663857 RepID=UPI001322007D|nr:nuclear transport factor 2 family protein [Nocardioides marmotae]MBC9734629.1 nuclear transport factor 2 family protein [Nocardioides marmotae]MTB85731.1 hypothetical protein [Nocardioides marmotae]